MTICERFQGKKLLGRIPTVLTSRKYDPGWLFRILDPRFGFFLSRTVSLVLWKLIALLKEPSTINTFKKIPFGLPEFEFIDLFDSGLGLLHSVKGTGFGSKTLIVQYPA